MLVHAERRDSPHPELIRQAYLLTGDPELARQLAGRADGAARQHAARYGPEAARQHAQQELVRSFVADTDRPRPPAPDGAPLHPDVAAWQALRRLPPRRRAVLVLRYDEGLAEEEVAARLGTSAQSVRADVDAAMLTLRTALSDGQDPWTRVVTALAAAGRGWSDYTRPAPERVAEVLAAPRPEPRAARPERSRAGHLRPAVVAAGSAALVLLAAVLVLPRLGDDPAPAAPAAADTSAATDRQVSARSAGTPVPTATVAKGLLNWPARGTLAEDRSVAGAATAAWRRAVPPAQGPATGLTVLWAGELDGRTSTIVQALDRDGRPRVAQLTGPATGSLTLAAAQPLVPGTAVLSVLPPTGPSGPVRVLVSPEVQVADGLLAGNPMDGSALRPTLVGVDGMSGVLPSPPGVPTCSRVVLLGLDRGPGGQPVLQSGVVTADKLGAMSMEVEVGTSTLAAASAAAPETVWFADGARLARKVAGTGTLTVAAFGPRLDPRPLSTAEAPTVSSRAYELRRGDRRWLGSVVEVGGKVVCASVTAVDAPPAGPAGWVLRCPLPGATAGLLHVVGAADTSSVSVTLAPTPAPAGQRPYSGTLERDAAHPDDSFAVLAVVPAGFPCGAGTVQAAGDRRRAAPVTLPLYRP